MTFSNLPNASQIFIDANILIYHAGADPTYGPACKQLMERIARREIHGFTSTHVLCDLAHRIMTSEAIARFNLPAKGIASHLRHQPTDVQKLTRFRQAVEEVPLIGVHVLPVDFSLVSAATAISQQTGLLTNDALVVAVMRQHGLTNLASADDDFDGVPGITRLSPI